MHFIDYALIVFYLGGLLYLGFTRRISSNARATELIVGGRMLTLPGFVASLVSTWYGGILGVGEYSFRFGVSNWLVFGVPYYLAAALFAIFLAKKARESEVLTIPDKLAAAYDDKTSFIGAVVIYIMTVPAAYVLMLGVLCQFLFGWPLWIGVLLGTLFSIVYVFLGGFRSVVRTDLIQFVLMFVGFIVLLVVLFFSYGGYDYLCTHLPEQHLTWNGGNSTIYIAVWYFIAMATLIEPAFYQRCYAVKNVSTARRGIFISILFWALFDFLTTSCGLYARAILPNLSDPVSSFPSLAMHVLPAGLLGLFALALLATVMSTIDSYSFLAASTFSRDIVQRRFGIDPSRIALWTRIGLIVSVGLAVVLALFFRSVVDIWHGFGSVGTPALLIPVLAAFVGRRTMAPIVTRVSILCSGGISLIWYLSKYFSASGEYWLGMEPIFPGLILSATIFLVSSQPTRTLKS